jgi:hypothetical protein
MDEPLEARGYAVERSAPLLRLPPSDKAATVAAEQVARNDLRDSGIRV